MQIALPDFESSLQSNPALRTGCMIDTNVLFAASFPLDTFNEWAEDVFKVLHENEVPVFTNINVRSEFIELCRRVMIPEGLVDLYDDLGGNLDPAIEQKLKSLKTLKEKAAKENRTYKLNDVDIKRYRDLLEEFQHPSGKNGWDLFCNDYFHRYIHRVWEDAVDALKIKFIGSRDTESSEYFDSPPKWERMVDIVGKFGVGSSDAMIINLFVESKLPLIVTSDRDVAKAVLGLNLPGKYILAP